MVHIPDRTSSKRALVEEDVDAKLEVDLVKLRKTIDIDIKTARKKLKPQPSYDSKFWNQAADIVELEKQRAEVTRKISIRDFKEDSQIATFEDTEKARGLFLEIKAAECNKRMYTNQAERLKTHSDQQKSNRRSFIELFSTSVLGLNRIKAGMGRRDPDDQTTFRRECISVYKSSDTINPKNKHLYCPITKRWWPPTFTKAAHIFAYGHGQNTMDAIFGNTRPSELFSAHNGMIMCETAEQYMDAGYLAIVPRLPNDPTLEDIQNWNTSEPKEYKIRILDPKWAEKSENIDGPHGTQTWGDLDGEPVEFRSNFRPRARYLYFLYCVQMLKRAWSEGTQGTIIGAEMKKLYWGTPGKYLPANMLLAFVEEMGHDYESLLEGATDAQEVCEGTENVLLAAATNQIKASANQIQASVDGAEDEDEDEDESENEGKDEALRGQFTPTDEESDT